MDARTGWKLPPLAQNYAMNVAETASTFAEMILADAAVKNAANDDERLVLLEDKLQSVVAFFMNIHARFLFEKNFYEQRKNGLVSAAELDRLMLEAQETAFKGALTEYEPHFWASKLHFYITSYPFYNFPWGEVVEKDLPQFDVNDIDAIVSFIRASISK